MASAAYNLCILTIKDRPVEGLSWFQKAVALNPQEPKYAFTLVFFQKEQGDLKNAEATLQDFLTRHPGFADGYLLLFKIYLQRGDRRQTEAVLRQAQQVESLSPRDRARVTEALQKLGSL